MLHYLLAQCAFTVEMQQARTQGNYAQTSDFHAPLRPQECTR